ncbi:hypothetical protein [Caulobacter phage Cr30]|uniref:hypothetical protein n=1 Tax=Caulobacter phage Cr30 TaxID=1357714 RepID=UPI0004A9BA8F|nr:hypothetical protein OZ74_gp084 [Caulobacter phage Cr30]AGS80969.1 hypothetical protein [Caulobacter phage Cr30]
MNYIDWKHSDTQPEEYDHHPIMQFVYLKGWSEHHDRIWNRDGFGIARISKEENNIKGYHHDDIKVIMKRFDMDYVDQVYCVNHPND